MRFFVDEAKEDQRGAHRMDISVVVPTYNRRTVLQRSIDALLHQSLPSSAYEIVVVDDGSLDDTAAYLEEKTKTTPNLRYFRSEINRGRTTTRNIGILAANGDLIVLIDDDIVVDPEFLAIHQQYHAGSPTQHIAVVSNLSYPPELVTTSNLVRYLQSRYIGNRSAKERKQLDYSNLPSRFFSGGASSVRRDDLIEVGLFDTDLKFYGGEDEYMGHCLACSGVRIVFANAAHAVHYDSVSFVRHKQKVMEATREGYRLIRDKSPDYFETTQIRFLEPINFTRDHPRRIAAKMILRVLINPIVLTFAEFALSRMDRTPRLYCPILYRFVFAGWILIGQKPNLPKVGSVTYDVSAVKTSERGLLPIEHTPLEEKQ